MIRQPAWSMVRRWQAFRPCRLVLLGLSLLAGGCGTMVPQGGSLETTSHMDQGVQIESRFTQAIYRHEGDNHLTVVLLDGDEANLTQAAILRMQWKPRAGRTPLDENAFNVTVQYLIFSGPQQREIGIYSGAGYLFPSDDPGDPWLNGELLQATVLLTDRSSGFADLLGQANMQGGFSARLDPQATEAWVTRLTQMASAKLAYPRLVQSGR